MKVSNGGYCYYWDVLSFPRPCVSEAEGGPGLRARGHCRAWAQLREEGCCPELQPVNEAATREGVLSQESKSLGAERRGAHSRPGPETGREAPVEKTNRSGSEPWGPVSTAPLVTGIAKGQKVTLHGHLCGRSSLHASYNWVYSNVSPATAGPI